MCRDVETVDIEALANEEAMQHPAAREGVVQMKFVDPEHQRQVGGWNRSRQTIDAPPDEAEGAA
jgi:hypothetical protein